MKHCPLIFVLFLISVVYAGNPLVTNTYSADPSARVFGDRLYIYCSHDLPEATYWDMTDWRVLSSDDLRTWKDHGSFVDLKVFKWASQYAWAPDCLRANGKYYLFLPVDRTKIGIAVGDHPEGPFTDAIGKPLIDSALQPQAGPEPIDPAVFTDGDGTTYLYFGCRRPKVVRLDQTITKLGGAIQQIELRDALDNKLTEAESGVQPNLPEGYAEAPFVFKRDNKYYFTYSNGWSKDSSLVYAVGSSPVGPFTYAGELMKHVESVTQHGSVVEFKNKWYIVYHTEELSHGNTFRRCVCMEELTFRPDGSIIPATATKAGPTPLQ